MPANRHIAHAEADLYAQTLLDGLAADGGVDAVVEGLGQMEQILAYNRSHIELTNALEDPDRTPEECNKLVQAVFADCQPTLKAVLGVMAERGDFDALSRILDAFRDKISGKLGVTVVDVTTYVELDDHLRDLIKRKVNADFGTEVVLRERIDRSILGGIIMNANGKRIDASMATMLDNARFELRKNK